MVPPFIEYRFDEVSKNNSQFKKNVFKMESLLEVSNPLLSMNENEEIANEPEEKEERS